MEFTDTACKVFRECALVPSIAGATVLCTDPERSRYEVRVNWEQRDLERGKQVVTTKSYFVERKGDHVVSVCGTTFQADSSSVLRQTFSGDGGVRAVLLKDKSSKAEPGSEPQQYIEVWRSGNLVKVIEVPSLKKHGIIHENAQFGSFQLSSDGTKLVYVAEREKPKTCSFFQKVKEPPAEGKAPKKGMEYEYEDSWGERLKKVVQPVVVVLEWDTEECYVVDLQDKYGSISAGLAQWVPGDPYGVAFVGWENEPRKLGFVACMNRRQVCTSAVYYANVKTQEYTRLTSCDHHCFSPRFNPQGDKLLFLQGRAGGPHIGCLSLQLIDWSTKAVSTIIDTVETPQEDGFPGLYSMGFSEYCWDKSGSYIVFHDGWKSIQNVLFVDVAKRCVGRLTGGGGHNLPQGSWTVLCVREDLVVAHVSSPSTTPRLMVCSLKSVPEVDLLHWTELEATFNPFNGRISWAVMEFKSSEEGGQLYEAIVLRPTAAQNNSSLPPLIVYPHGGPHVNIVTEFMVWPACLACLGFVVLLVNYRGSKGYGNASIYSLPGRCGTADVVDCHNAALDVIAKGMADGGKVVVLGGSHGGFLAAHLVAQYPDFYKAAAMRNPVINFPGMVITTDIPDWNYVEAGLDYDSKRLPSSEDYSKMLAVSPIVLADQIKSPVLICIGAEDMRVPPTQGRQLYHTLKALGRETRLLVYPNDSHPISNVASDADSFVNSAIWLHNACL
ncbi:hypothetical protein EMCRGX_G000706 [Ephydatia muelleri]